MGRSVFAVIVFWKEMGLSSSIMMHVSCCKGSRLTTSVVGVAGMDSSDGGGVDGGALASIQRLVGREYEMLKEYRV